MSQMISWGDILRVTEKLGYQMEPRRGSARTFTTSQREPFIATFHEPHGGQVIYKARVCKRLKITMAQLAELAR